MPQENAVHGSGRSCRVPQQQGLYHPQYEHDACGMGLVASIRGEKSHDIIRKGLEVLINLTHRGAAGCDPETGDGAGILIQIPHAFFARECGELGMQLPGPGEYGVANQRRAMRVRYCLYDKEPSNELLLEQRQRSIEEPLPSAPASECIPGASGWTTTTLVEHVTNRAGGQKRPLFTYSASEAPQVVSVEINLYLEVAPGQHPGETELMSGVSLRNANRKPVAKLKANFFAGKNEQVVLNASESEDPDGLALTYKWWENGTQLSSTSQIFTVKLCNGECEHKLTFHFKLEVVNPGGLTEHAEETVET